MNYSDEALIETIQNGGPQLNKVMTFLYQNEHYRGFIINWLMQRNATREDAEDIFQDGIKHFILNVRNNNFKGQSTIKTYLTRICTNLWFSKLRRSNHYEDIKQKIVQDEGSEPTPEDIFFANEKETVLKEVLSSLGPLCQKILGLWSLNFKMKEIAQKMEYKSEGMARKKKHQCFQKLMLFLKDRPELSEALLQFYQSR